MTNQEMFNRVWNGLKAQGFERAWNSGTIVLIDLLGRKCAAGHLLTDAELVESNQSLVPAFAYIAARYPESGGLKNALVDCHDCSSCPADMEERLRLVAEKHDLEVPE